MRKGFVDDTFESHGALVEVVARDRLLIALAEEFIRDVERDEDGQTEHVAGGSGV